MLILVFVIAVGIIAYYAFHAGKAVGFDEAAVQNALADSRVTASVKNKYSTTDSRNATVHVAVFECDDGEEREFVLDKEIFDALYINQRDTLFYSGAIFLGFGEYGEIENDIVVGASVKNKYFVPDSKGSLSYVVEFTCDDGAECRFALDKEIFKALYVGQRDTLTCNSTMFLGFGPYGGTEIDGDEAVGVLNNGDVFHDDFDERIDIEQSIASPDENTSLRAEDREAFKKFSDYDKLPRKSQLITDEADSLDGYTADKLLQKMTIYPFLKREEKIARMFEKTYADAVDDMLGYDGNSRQGQAADDLFMNRNMIRLVVTVGELPPPLRCTITAELGVND